MTMTVISTRDELLAYYERRGYRRTGRIEPFPEEHAVHIRPGAEVELETLVKSLGLRPQPGDSFRVLG